MGVKADTEVSLEIGVSVEITATSAPMVATVTAGVAVGVPKMDGKTMNAPPMNAAAMTMIAIIIGRRERVLGGTGSALGRVGASCGGR